MCLKVREYLKDLKYFSVSGTGMQEAGSQGDEEVNMDQLMKGPIC